MLPRTPNPSHVAPITLGSPRIQCSVPHDPNCAPLPRLHNNPNRGSLSLPPTSLAPLQAAAIAHFMWHAAVYASNVILSSAEPMIVFQKPVGIPVFGIFQTFACLSFPLMWMQVHHRNSYGCRLNN